MATLFDTTDKPDGTMFDNIMADVSSFTEQKTSPVKTMITAAGTMNRDNPQPAVDLGQGALEAAQAALSSGQENAIRSQTALDRQVRQAKTLKNYRSNVDNILNPSLAAGIDHAYNLVTSQDIEKQKHVALETQAYENIQDMLTHGDPVEAKVVYDNMNKGGAYEVQRDNAVKNLILAQRAAEIDEDVGQEGWGHWALTMAMGLVPGQSLLAHSSITGNQKDRSFIDVLTGKDLSNQIEDSWGESVSDFAQNWAQDGKYTSTLKSRSSFLGVYNPATAADTLSHFQHGFATKSDQHWAALWGDLDVAAVGGMVPWSKIGSVTGSLTRMGARKAAVKAAVNTMMEVEAEGTAKAAAKTGINSAELEVAQSNSLIHPNEFTEHDVPLGRDVDTHLKAARDAVREMNDTNMVSRITNPQELQNAYDGIVTKLEKQYGHPIKDYKPMIEDIKTGEHYGYDGNLPNHGNYVPYVEVTFGRKEGGGFATAEAAENAARGSGFGDYSVFGEVGSRRVSAAEDGFNIRAYHGTDGDFENFNFSRVGKTGGAKDEAVFLTDNPDVAWTYSREAARAGQDKYRIGKPNIAGEEGNIRPTNVKLENPLTVDMEGQGYDSQKFRSIIDEARNNGHDGVVFKNTDDSFGANPRSEIDPNAPRTFEPHTVYAVFKPENIKSVFEADRVVQDVSGQHFFKGRVNVPETGFYTNPLNVPPQNFLARWLRSSARLSDPLIHAKAVAADSQIDRMQKLIGRKLKETGQGLNSTEKKGIDQILLAGQNKSKWYSDDEFNAGYERLTGQVASDKALQAYKDYRLLNDMDWVLRNDEVYMSKAIRGFQSFEFDAGAQTIKMDGHINFSPSEVPRERVFNATENRHYTSQHPLSQAELRHLNSDGYVMIDMETGTQLADGTFVKKVLIRKSDLQVRPLEREQLPYSEGGHRLYTDKYFGKQAVRGTQSDTGTEFLSNPNTFVTFANKAEGDVWARTMNEAREYVMKGGVDAQHLDDNVFRGHKGYMSGREFIDGYQGGFIGKDPFEVTFDREMPTAYTSRPDSVSLYLDEGETGFNDYYRTTGRMYYSSKGKALKTFDSSMPDTASDLATTVDPWDALSTSLFNITRNVGLSNYKTSVVDRFIKTFRNDLNLDGLTEEELASPNSIFNSAKTKRGLPIVRQQQIESQRSAIQRVLGFETEHEKFNRQFYRSTAEWALGDATGGPRKALHDSIWWVRDKNPLNVIHGLAFDAKLGLFNVGQLFVQATTMISATALSPSFGLKGMLGAMPLHGYLISKGSENVLDVLAKRGIGKLMGFADEAEFKTFARYMNTNGFHDVTGTHVMVQNYGPSRVFGSFAADAREAGRAPFYAAEVYNRIVANRIAWGELKEQGLDHASPLFRERLLGLSSDYSFNMTSADSAYWQKGLLSIPTQFWAYNQRMIDAMLGSRFTPRQRGRLILAQLGMAGTAGVPLVDTIASYVRQKHDIDIDASPMLTTAYRGLIDSAFKYGLDTDVRIGSRLGAGSWVTQTVSDIFGMGEFGVKSTASTLVGASGNIAWDTAGVLGDTAKYAFAETGGDTGQPIVKEDLLKLASEVSTVSNGMKAYLVSQYGYFKSNKGTISVDGLPSQDAFMIALGFQPQETDKLGQMFAVLKDNDQQVKEAATRVRNWRQEAFTNPDKMESNAQKVNTFMNLLPPSIRLQVLKQTNKVTDGSLYDHVAQKYQQQKLNQEMDK